LPYLDTERLGSNCGEHRADEFADIEICRRVRDPSKLPATFIAEFAVCYAALHVAAVLVDLAIRRVAR